MTQNRLQMEALHRSKSYQIIAVANLVTAASTGIGISAGSPQHTMGWWAVGGMVIASAMSWRMSILNRRRADWFGSTPEWWLHLDEAPEILPLPPRVYVTLRFVEEKGISRKTRSVAYGTSAALAVLGAILLAVGIMADINLTSVAGGLAWLAASISILAWVAAKRRMDDEEWSGSR